MRTKQNIMSILEKAYADDSYMLVGEQLMGPWDFPNDMLKRYSTASDGQYPALLGIDFGNYGMNLTALRDDPTEENNAKWNEFLAQTVAYAKKGGIVTASHHWANPTYDMHEANGTLTPKMIGEGRYTARGSFGDGSLEYWDRLLQEGDPINTAFKHDLDCGAEFLLALKAEGVNVLWRPMHEANGGWFWFCALCPGLYKEVPETTDRWVPAEKMKAVWRYVYDYYTDGKGLDNLIWVYAPNTGRNGEWGVQGVMYYYPGEKYADIVGADWYTTSKSDLGIFDRHRSYEKFGGRIFAMTEFGPACDLQKKDPAEQEKVFSSLDVLALMKSLTKDCGMKCCYMLTWHEGYGAFSSMGKAKEALSDPFFCTLERLNAITAD